MSSSLPDGFRARVATPADIQAAADIVRAEEKSLRGESIWDVSDIADFWRLANFADGSWMIERDGLPVGFVACLERGDETHSWASVHPEAGGNGLATWLLERAEQRARKVGSRSVQAGRFAENTVAHALLERLGFREVRHFYRMRIELDGEPEPPHWPTGLEPAPFRLEDGRAFHEALNEAFAEEWGFHSMPFDEWRRIRLEAPDTDLSLWFLARDGDEIAGVARCEGKRDGGGWIGALGVRKAWRRRGLGLALLRHAFREFHRRGEPHVGLGVDAANATGATQLYERAGMRVISEDVVYEKELA
jgi:ribosomal protein S18 acetylase RimI-like enzyme